MTKRALITGITGQDGSYLAELLLAKDYHVFGMVRHSSSSTHRNIDHLKETEGFELVTGDMNDTMSLFRVVNYVQPDEIYNLAAQSFVGSSWKLADYTLRTNAVAVENLLSVVRQLCDRAKFYQASSSEMFGNTDRRLLSIDSGFRPCSPYGVSKLAAHHTAINYRETYGMFVSCGVLFNHESPRRGLEFVTQKIATGLAKISLGLTAEKVQLGNIGSHRDWGYAKDYVEAMWLMLQQDRPQDIVVGTGRECSVEKFIIYCMNALKLGGVMSDYVNALNPLYVRAGDLYYLRANPDQAIEVLNWRATTTVEELASLMCHAAVKRLHPGK